MGGVGTVQEYQVRLMDIDRAEGFHDLGNPGQGWFLGRRRGDVVGTWGMWWELWRSVHHGPKLEFS